MRRLLTSALLCLATTTGAFAQACVDITAKVVFCPADTLWDGLTWQRISEPESTVWETQDLVLIIGLVPVQFPDGPIEIGQKQLADAIDDFAAIPESAEVIARFAPLGDGVPATARVTHDAARGVVEYVTLYTLGGEILMIRTVANADSLTQDHGIRHEQALRALAETGI